MTTIVHYLRIHYCRLIAESMENNVLVSTHSGSTFQDQFGHHKNVKVNGLSRIFQLLSIEGDTRIEKGDRSLFLTSLHPLETVNKSN